MGERKPKRKIVGLALAYSDYAALLEEAAELSKRLGRQVTVQDVIREVIREHLERRGRKSEVPGRAG